MITTKKHDVIIQMKDGVDQWQILERFQKLGIGLRSFGVYEPSLNDIFVSAVGEEDTAEDVKRKNNIGTSFFDFEPEKKKKDALVLEREVKNEKHTYDFKI